MSTLNNVQPIKLSEITEEIPFETAEKLCKSVNGSLREDSLLCDYIDTELSHEKIVAVIIKKCERKKPDQISRDLKNIDERKSEHEFFGIFADNPNQVLPLTKRAYEKRWAATSRWHSPRYFSDFGGDCIYVYHGDENYFDMFSAAKNRRKKS